VKNEKTHVYQTRSKSKPMITVFPIRDKKASDTLTKYVIMADFLDVAVRNKDIKSFVYRVNAHAKCERLYKHVMQDGQKDVATALGELKVFLELQKGKKKEKNVGS
jgi:hypothetical protein